MTSHHLYILCAVIGLSLGAVLIGLGLRTMCSDPEHEG